MIASSAPASAPRWLNVLFPAPAQPWKNWQRLLFRGIFVYLALGLIEFILPYDHLLYSPINALYLALTHRSLPALGGAEPLFNYLVMYAQLVFSGALAVIWSGLERRGGLTERLFWPTHTLLRYFLASMLFAYGWDKVFLMQMPAPTVTDMLTPYGEMSHMGLLWRMVGASPLFEMVGGWAEVIPACLLLVCRTSLPGALLSAGVMGFVFLLNISFDVIVKISSGHLFVYSLLLLTPYLGNLVRLLQNRPTQPVSYPAMPALPWLRWLGWLLRAVALYWAVWLPLNLNLTFKAKWTPAPLHSQLGGLYEVVSDSRPASQSLTDDQRWSRVAFDQTAYPGGLPFFRIVRVNREIVRGRYAEDAKNARLTLKESTPLTLSYRRRPDGTLTLSGTEGGQPFTAELKPASKQATFIRDEPPGWVIDQTQNR
ncbi:hypothetical protein [Deinococcus ruber]|uniref:DoxX family protein n=1 Tax=Deinococcus ruber TaxID=1848197 RepID=A0A918BZH3_9DEIO|nr:hypothetical protein [Deinococcus ruber]GGQ98255.1 hypothetical protein GCM10008957_08240 [Deinococcus ruber]